MKATVEPGALAAACKLTSAAISAKATMPVLAGVHIVPCDAGLRLSTFDLETSVETVVHTEVPPSGDPVLVSHRLLTQVASVAGKKPLALTKDRQLLATSGRSEWRMPLMFEDDYPKLPKLPDPLGKVDAAELADAIRAVSLAAGRDESLPMLTGVHITFAGDQLVLACTDRYRLHTAAVTWSPTGDAADHKPILVPARSVRTVAGFSHGTAELYASGNLFAIAVDDTRFTTRLLDHSFPAWQSLMPTRDAALTRVTVEPAQLLDAVRQVAVGAGEKVPLRVTFRADGGISMEARDDDANVVGTAEIDALVEGDAMTTAISHVFLADALSTVTGPVEIQLTAPTRPVAFAAPGEEPQSIVMPVRLPG